MPLPRRSQPEHIRYSPRSLRPDWRDLDISDSYQSNAAEKPFMRRWLFIALIASLCIHLALFLYFRSTPLQDFTITSGARLVPRNFTVDRAQIDSKLLQQETAPHSESKHLAPQPLPLPKENTRFDQLMGKVRVAPDVPTDLKPAISDKPHIDNANLQVLAAEQAQASDRSIEKNLAAIQNKLLQNTPKTDDGTISELAQTASANHDLSGGASGISSQIDKMLANYGQLKGSTGTLQMPGDAFFGFGNATINPGVAAILEKLGKLIQKNPNTTLVIDGFTDSIGSPQYNSQLSLARANAVRDWLVQHIGILPEQMQTRGLGKSHFIVAPRQVDLSDDAAVQAEIQREQPNRRVEIIIRFPK